MPFTEGSRGAATDGRDCGGDRRGRGGIPTQASAHSRDPPSNDSGLFASNLFPIRLKPSH